MLISHVIFALFDVLKSSIAHIARQLLLTRRLLTKVHQLLVQRYVVRINELFTADIARIIATARMRFHVTVHSTLSVSFEPANLTNNIFLGCVLYNMLLQCTKT